MARLSGPRFVPAAKIERYLLALDHEDGGPKARFFVSFGFTPDDPDQLTAALLDHAARHSIIGERETLHGTNRLIRGTLMTPNHRRPLVDAIWFQPSRDLGHRFVTAYPT